MKRVMYKGVKGIVMWKWVMEDYFKDFRLRNLKEKLWNKQTLQFVFCIWVWTPFTMGFYKEEYIIVYFCISWMVVYKMISRSLHSIRQSKIDFLCPMQREHRREYISKKILWYILSDAVVGSIGIVILISIGLIDGVSASALLICLAWWAIAGKDGFTGKIMEEQLRKHMNISMCIGVQILIAIGAFVVPMGVGCMLCWDTPVAWWVKWIFVGMAVIILLPVCVWVLTYWDEVVEKAVDYEKSYL